MHRRNLRRQHQGEPSAVERWDRLAGWHEAEQEHGNAPRNNDAPPIMRLTKLGIMAESRRNPIWWFGITTSRAYRIGKCPGSPMLSARPLGISSIPS
jgi:hypothetical protein